MMVDININVYGYDELQRKWKHLSGELKSEIEKATYKATLYVHSQVPPYPAEPAASTYHRTGTLGRSITTEVRSIGSEIVGVIGTATVYAPWVISDEPVGSRGPQAWMHKGRWWTLQGVVLKAKDAIIAIYEQAVQDLLRS